MFLLRVCVCWKIKQSVAANCVSSGCDVLQKSQLFVAHMHNAYSVECVAAGIKIWDDFDGNVCVLWTWWAGALPPYLTPWL